MQPAQLFQFCPRCGARRLAENAGQVPLCCPACDLTFFFNPTVAAAAWVFDAAGRVLVIRRAREPARGTLAIPGGFIDIGETAEAALRRETLEEVGLELAAIDFLTSVPNLYDYRNVTYPVLDLVFTASAVNPDAVCPLDGVAGIEWRYPADIDPAELAFPSLRESLQLLRAK
jgi:ADP-ribose pyrophosphatase YjhB (NUDIX family)